MIKIVVRYKKIWALAFLLVLLSPKLIKISHFLYVPHQHAFSHHNSSGTTLDTQHRSCHICAYKFAELIVQKHIALEPLREKYQPVIFSYQNLFYSSFKQRSCKSRAPPIS